MNIKEMSIEKKLIAVLGVLVIILIIVCGIQESSISSQSDKLNSDMGVNQNQGYVLKGLILSLCNNNEACAQNFITSAISHGQAPTP